MATVAPGPRFFPHLFSRLNFSPARAPGAPSSIVESSLPFFPELTPACLRCHLPGKSPEGTILLPDGSRPSATTRWGGRIQLPRKKLESPAEGVSRRTFLKGAGIAAAAVGVSGVDVAGETPSSQESLIVGPGPVPFQLTINGDTRSIEVPPSTTLLDLLRDKLGMTGSKRVCDRGSCGACTVMFDGKIVDSCSILAIDAVGREITTIEGIGTPENLSALQQAFIECDALQCGFCTPAMVVSCTALLNDNAKPTRDEIRAGISGNLCRCGTYINVFEAVEKTSGQGGRDD